MQNYDDALRAFSVEDEVRACGLPDGAILNACYCACDRHAAADRPALRWLGLDGTEATLGFAELRDRSAQFAGLLRDVGVRPGDRVAALLPRRPELLIAILGTWRAGAVYHPLFTAFGPKAIDHRLATAGTRLVVTDPANRAKLDGLSATPKVVALGGPATEHPEHLDFWSEMNRRSVRFDPVERGNDDPFLLMFTSGTTGASKALQVPLRAIISFAQYMRVAIGLTAADRFWNVADPGWAYGLYYGVVGPLALGHATTFVESPFSATSAYDAICRLGITNLAGAPTAYRLMMAAGPELARRVKGRLRAVSSAGEPLNPEVIRWFADHLGVAVHDHYGQTEIGMVVCNHHGLGHPVRPGSAGYPVPGYRVLVVDDVGGRTLGPDEPGILAVDRSGSPMFWYGGYENQATPSFVGDYYLSGDTVVAKPDGSFDFVGRADDVITSAGYRIGPFEVESALIEHPAVAEAAVIGEPDPERTEIVKAFVVLMPGRNGSTELGEELKQHVRRRLSAHAYPRIVVFVDALPKTPSGKVQRFVLRNRSARRLERPDEL